VQYQVISACLHDSGARFARALSTKQERSLRSLPEPKESIKKTEITRLLVILRIFVFAGARVRA
jgi:hypothetical protein